MIEGMFSLLVLIALHLFFFISVANCCSQASLKQSFSSQSCLCWKPLKAIKLSDSFSRQSKRTNTAAQHQVKTTLRYDFLWRRHITRAGLLLFVYCYRVNASVWSDVFTEGNPPPGAAARWAGHRSVGRDSGSETNQSITQTCLSGYIHASFYVQRSKQTMCVLLVCIIKQQLANNQKIQLNFIQKIIIIL